MHAFIKQAVGIVATPLTITLFVAILAGALRAFGRGQCAKRSLISAALIAYLGSTAPVGDALLGPLERAYPPLLEDSSLHDVPYVVVLGTAYNPRGGIPITGALSDDGLARVVEGVRLVKKITRAKLVLSGGAPPEGIPSALGYAILAQALGIDYHSLVVIDNTLDTDDEAKAIARLIGNERFILVTSASHMPRAMRLMHLEGLYPIPGPTAYRVDDSKSFSLLAFLPNSHGLRKSEYALHEYLGMAASAAGAL